MDREVQEDRALDAGFALIKRLVAKRTRCVAGMAAFCSWADGKPGGSWAKLARVDWSQDLAPVSAWFAHYMARHKPPAGIRGIWFGVPEIELNPADMAWSAHRKYNAKGGSLEWATDPVWPRNFGEDAVSVKLAALNDARKLLGLDTKAYNERAARRESLSAYLVPLAYASLLMTEVLASLPSSSWGSATKKIGAVAGFQFGDWITLPALIVRRGKRAS